MARGLANLDLGLDDDMPTPPRGGRRASAPTRREESVADLLAGSKDMGSKFGGGMGGAMGGGMGGGRRATGGARGSGGGFSLGGGDPLEALMTGGGGGGFGRAAEPDEDPEEEEFRRQMEAAMGGLNLDMDGLGGGRTPGRTPTRTPPASRTPARQSASESNGSLDDIMGDIMDDRPKPKPKPAPRQRTPPRAAPADDFDAFLDQVDPEPQDDPFSAPSSRAASRRGEPQDDPYSGPSSRAASRRGEEPASTTPMARQRGGQPAQPPIYAAEGSFGAMEHSLDPPFAGFDAALPEEPLIGRRGAGRRKLAPKPLEEEEDPLLAEALGLGTGGTGARGGRRGGFQDDPEPPRSTSPAPFEDPGMGALEVELNVGPKPKRRLGAKAKAKPAAAPPPELEPPMFQDGPPSRGRTPPPEEELAAPGGPLSRHTTPRAASPREPSPDEEPDLDGLLMDNSTPLAGTSRRTTPRAAPAPAADEGSDSELPDFLRQPREPRARRGASGGSTPAATTPVGRSASGTPAAATPTASATPRRATTPKQVSQAALDLGLSADDLGPSGSELEGAGLLLPDASSSGGIVEVPLIAPKREPRRLGAAKAKPKAKAAAEPPSARTPPAALSPVASAGGQPSPGSEQYTPPGSAQPSSHHSAHHSAQQSVHTDPSAQPSPHSSAHPSYHPSAHATPMQSPSHAAPQSVPYSIHPSAPMSMQQSPLHSARQSVHTPLQASAPQSVAHLSAPHSVAHPSMPHTAGQTPLQTPYHQGSPPSASVPGSTPHSIAQAPPGTSAPPSAAYSAPHSEPGLPSGPGSARGGSAVSPQPAPGWPTTPQQAPAGEPVHAHQAATRASSPIPSVHGSQLGQPGPGLQHPGPAQLHGGYHDPYWQGHHPAVTDNPAPMASYHDTAMQTVPMRLPPGSPLTGTVKSDSIIAASLVAAGPDPAKAHAAQAAAAAAAALAADAAGTVHTPRRCEAGGAAHGAATPASEGPPPSLFGSVRGDIPAFGVPPLAGAASTEDLLAQLAFSRAKVLQLELQLEDCDQRWQARLSDQKQQADAEHENMEMKCRRLEVDLARAKEIHEGEARHLAESKRMLQQSFDTEKENCRREERRRVQFDLEKAREDHVRELEELRIKHERALALVRQQAEVEAELLRKECSGEQMLARVAEQVKEQVQEIEKVGRRMDTDKCLEYNVRERKVEEGEKRVREAEARLSVQSRELEEQRQRVSELVRRMEESQVDDRTALSSERERLELEHKRLLELQKNVREADRSNKEMLKHAWSQLEEERRSWQQEQLRVEGELNARREEVESQERHLRTESERLKVLHQQIEVARQNASRRIRETEATVANERRCLMNDLEIFEEKRRLFASEVEKLEQDRKNLDEEKGGFQEEMRAVGLMASEVQRCSEELKTMHNQVEEAQLEVQQLRGRISEERTAQGDELEKLKTMQTLIEQQRLQLLNTENQLRVRGIEDVDLMLTTHASFPSDGGAAFTGPGDYAALLPAMAPPLPGGEGDAAAWLPAAGGMSHPGAGGELMPWPSVGAAMTQPAAGAEVADLLTPAGPPVMPLEALVGTGPSGLESVARTSVPSTALDLLPRTTPLATPSVCAAAGGRAGRCQPAMPCRATTVGSGNRLQLQTLLRRTREASGEMNIFIQEQYRFLKQDAGLAPARPAAEASPSGCSTPTLGPCAAPALQPGALARNQALDTQGAFGARPSSWSPATLGRLLSGDAGLLQGPLALGTSSEDSHRAATPLEGLRPLSSNTSSA